MFPKALTLLVAVLLPAMAVVCDTAYAALALGEEQLAADGREITGLRTENSKTYELDNGQKRCDVYASDIFYRDVDGALVPIDNSITAVTRSPTYLYTNRANSWRAFFAKTLGSNQSDQG